MPRLWPVLLVSWFAMSGCKAARPADVVGTWEIKEEARQRLPMELQEASGTIVVKADRTFEARELPDEVDATGEKPRLRLDSGFGTWALKHADEGQFLELDFHRFDFGDRDSRGDFGFPVDMARTWSAWELYYFLGDPDQGRRVAFAKR